MEATESLNFGVIMHANNPIQRHVAILCHVYHYHLQGYLTYKMAVKLANAMVSSRLDYYNDLLYHIKKTNISRL